MINKSSVGPLIKGHTVNKEIFACFEENDGKILIFPENVMITFNCELLLPKTETKHTKRHCDNIIIYKKGKKLEIFFVELRSMGERNDKFIQTILEKILGTVDVFENFNKLISNYGEEIKKYFILILKPEALGTVGHFIKRSRSKFNNYKIVSNYNAIYIKKSGSFAELNSSHDILLYLSK